MGNIIKKYIEYIRKWIYEGIFLILLCAAYGSFHGATIEAKDEKSYILDDIPAIDKCGTEVPILTGYCGLAAKQNQWINFHKALKYAISGFFLYVLIIAFFCIINEIKESILRLKLGS